MAFITITPAEVDAKSPLDDLLMGKIKDDLDDLNSRVITAGNSPFVWEVYGRLAYIRAQKRSVAYALINKEFTPSICRYALKKSGTSGTFSFDLRKHTTPKTPIISISHQYSAATSSIARAGSSVSTQSISRVTPQIATQSISHPKAVANIQSIINVGGNLWQINLDTGFDSDVTSKDTSVVIAGATAGGNNGTFLIQEKNRSNGSNVVVLNASGVAQTSAAGTVQPKIMSYNFVNPVNSNFAAGESALFASHTSGVNNGAFVIYKTNQAGNNIWIKNAAGSTQAGIAGTTDVQRFIYAFLSAVSATDYIVGEKALCASHTSALNDGSLSIVAVNLSGNNLVLHNPVGVTQGGAAGNVNTNRWIYALPSDPSAQISANDTVFLSGHTTAANNGTFVARQINRSASNNIVIYNESGVAQAGAVGNTFTTRKLVSFSSDQSAIYTTDSFVEIANAASSLYNFAEGRSPFKVLQVNRGGGANYNIVIDAPTAPSQASPAGFVQVEMKSIFTATPTLAAAITGDTADQLLTGSSTSISATAIPANTPIMLYLLTNQNGDPRDLTIILS